MGDGFGLWVWRAASKSRKWKLGIASAAAGLFFLYAGVYLALRASWSEVWHEDGHAYMIYPRNAVALYYLFRPLAYADGALTGMRFHIGPHQ